MKKTVIWIGAIFIGLLIIGRITAKDIEEPEDKSLIAFKQGEEKYKIGDVVTIGDLEYKVEELSQALVLKNKNIRENLPKNFNQNLSEKQYEELSEFFSTEANKPGKLVGEDEVFLIAKIKVTNISTEHRKNVYPSMFKLVESDGTVYDADIPGVFCMEGNYDLFLSDIDPKASKTGYVVFIITNIESSYALKVSGGQFSSREELIYFTNEKILEYSN